MTPTVLYTCSYVPEEIIAAAGGAPRRFFPRGAAADAWMHPNTCGYVQSMLATALDNGGVDAAAIIIANSCDAMRRLYDLWTEHIRAVPALFLDVPKQADADSIVLFAAELRQLAKRLPAVLSARAIDAPRLQAAIRASNESRRVMAEVFAAQRAAGGSNVGTRVFDLCLAGTTEPGKDLAARSKEYLAGAEGTHPSAPRPRIVLSGGLMSRRDVVAEIEHAGAQVVALDTCLGLRHYHGLVAEDAPDPFVALAGRYLTKPSCARMQGLAERIGWIRRVAAEARADGIVFCTQKFCGPCVYDTPMLSEACGSVGIPFLAIEHDYDGAGLEQLRARIGAFIELRQQIHGGTPCSQ